MAHRTFLEPSLPYLSGMLNLLGREIVVPAPLKQNSDLSSVKS
jgi:hypothetical protein